MATAIKPREDELSKEDLAKVIHTKEGLLLKQAQVLVIIGEHKDELKFGEDVKAWVEKNFPKAELKFHNAKPVKDEYRDYKEEGAAYLASLQDSIEKAKQVGADIIISIHHFRRDSIKPPLFKEITPIQASKEIYAGICKEDKDSKLRDYSVDDVYSRAYIGEGRDKLIKELSKFHYAVIEAYPLGGKPRKPEDEERYKLQVREIGMTLMRIQSYFTEM